MSVDYEVCSHCGDTFCDCGDYFTCDVCGKEFCQECGEDAITVDETGCDYCRGEIANDEEFLCWLYEKGIVTNAMEDEYLREIRNEKK